MCVTLLIDPRGDQHSQSPVLRAHRTVKETDLAPDSDGPEWSGWVGMLKQSGQGWDEVGTTGTRSGSSLHLGSQRGLSGEGRYLTNEKEPGAGRPGKNRAGSGYRKCEGPEVRRSLGCSGPTKEASVAESAARPRTWEGLADRIQQGSMG